MSIVSHPQRSRVLDRMRRKLWDSTSGMLGVVILLSLLAAILLYQVWHLVENDVHHPVQYGVSIISPLEAEVCPGPRALSYQVDVTVTADMIPDQGEIAEAWCGFGANAPCKAVPPLDNSDDDLPLLQEKHITGISHRDVPSFVRPGGVYEFQHSIKDAKGSVAGYIVTPIKIKDVCP